MPSAFVPTQSQQGSAGARNLTQALYQLQQVQRACTLLVPGRVQLSQQPLLEQHVASEYISSLQQQAAAAAAAAHPGTAAAAAAAVTEFVSWIQPRCQARGITLQTCSPIDVLVYFDTHWLPAHGSLLLADGAAHSAPSYLSGTISHLSGFFKRLGREGYYDYERQVGDPCLHSSISDFKKTYSKRMWQLGYATRSAKSVTGDQYSGLLQQLHREANGQLTSLAQQAHGCSYRVAAAKSLLLLLRDAAGITLAWSSAVRAQNAASVRLQDLQDRRGQPLQPRLLEPTYCFPAGCKWQFAPNGTKPCQQARAGCQLLEVPEEEHLDTLRWIHKLVQACIWAKVPIDGFLLRPLSDDQQNFKEEALSTDSLNKRLQHHLRRLGLFSGESSHGLRRGTSQHSREQGQSEEAVGRRLQHVQPGGPQTMQYLDSSREVGWPKRQRRG